MPRKASTRSPHRSARPLPLDGSLHPTSAGHRRRRDGTLSPEELDDEFFMMRIRIDGGQLASEQLRVIAGITDLHNIQFHWSGIKDVPEIWRRLESVGLDTMEACGDCTCTALGSPVAGVHPDELIDATPALDHI